MSYCNFNDATNDEPFNLIPAGTIAKVSCRIKPGGYNDEAQGWTKGYATKSQRSNAVFLSGEFTVLEGPYTKRKIWQLIGLYSDKNNNRWGAMGRSFIRSMLNSARGFSDQDYSVAAVQARTIESLADLDGLELVAKIEVTTDSDGQLKNVIKTALDSRYKDYQTIMGLGVVDRLSWE